MNITDIVVDINDFLIVANMKAGIIKMGTNGGISMMVKSAVKEDDKYLIKKFFNAILDIPSINQNSNIYYENVLIPPILVDHLFDLDTDENILAKIQKHLNRTASWFEIKGLMSIAEMSFDSDMSSHYRMYNRQNIKIVELLMDAGYRVHLLGNCSRRSLDKIIDHHGKFDVDSVTTSSDIGVLKCSKGDRYDMFDCFLKRSGLNPNNTLFIEVHQGYINAINNFNPNIPTILYRGKTEKRSFIKDLSKLLDIDLDYDYIIK